MRRELSETDLAKQIQKGVEAKEKLESQGDELDRILERDLHAKINAGDQALGALLEKNKALIGNVVNKFKPPEWLSQDQELESLGEVALYTAARKYKPEEHGNVRFASYAVKWIRGAVIRGIERQTGVSWEHWSVFRELRDKIEGSEGEDKDRTIEAFRLERDLTKKDIEYLLRIPKLISPSSTIDACGGDVSFANGFADEGAGVFAGELFEDAVLPDRLSWSEGEMAPSVARPSCDCSCEGESGDTRPMAKLSTVGKELLRRVVGDFDPEPSSKEMFYVAGYWPRHPYDLAAEHLYASIFGEVSELVENDKCWLDVKMKKKSRAAAATSFLAEEMKGKLLDEAVGDPYGSDFRGEEDSFGGGNASSKLYSRVGGAATVIRLARKLFFEVPFSDEERREGFVEGYWNKTDWGEFVQAAYAQAGLVSHKILIHYLKEALNIKNQDLDALLFLHRFNKSKLSHYLGGKGKYHPLAFRDPLEIAWSIILRLENVDEHDLVDRVVRQNCNESSERICKIARGLIREIGGGLSESRAMSCLFIDGDKLTSYGAALRFLTYACCLGTARDEPDQYCRKRFGTEVPMTGKFFSRSYGGGTEMDRIMEQSAARSVSVMLASDGLSKIVPSYPGEKITAKKERDSSSFLFWDISKVELHVGGRPAELAIKRGRASDGLYVKSTWNCGGGLKLGLDGRYLAPLRVGEDRLKFDEGELIAMDVDYPSSIFVDGLWGSASFDFVEGLRHRGILVAGRHDVGETSKDAVWISRRCRGGLRGIVPKKVFDSAAPEDEILLGPSESTTLEAYHILQIPSVEVSRFEKGERNRYGQCIIEWTSSRGWILRQVSEHYSVTVLVRSEGGKIVFTPVFRGGGAIDLEIGDVIVFLPLGEDEKGRRCFPDGIEEYSQLRELNESGGREACAKACAEAYRRHPNCCSIQWGCVFNAIPDDR